MVLDQHFVVQLVRKTRKRHRVHHFEICPLVAPNLNTRKAKHDVKIVAHCCNTYPVFNAGSLARRNYVRENEPWNIWAPVTIQTTLPGCYHIINNNAYFAYTFFCSNLKMNSAKWLPKWRTWNLPMTGERYFIFIRDSFGKRRGLKAKRRFSIRLNNKKRKEKSFVCGIIYVVCRYSLLQRRKIQNIYSSNSIGWKFL